MPPDASTRSVDRFFLLLKRKKKPPFSFHWQSRAATSATGSELKNSYLWGVQAAQDVL
jgi:hypothetical protein